MTVEIKICGLKSPDAVAAAVEHGADMVGLVFFEPSPRNIAIADAARLVADLPADVAAVALTVDADDRLIDRIASEVRPAMIQAHGHEASGRVEEITRCTGLPVMKVLPISAAGDFAAAADYEGVADRLLFDARPPERASRPGGHGVPFDWRLTRHYSGGLPWMLSGGLTPGNVAEAIALSGARAVDVSSGVERDLGVKDPELIAGFISAVREAELAAEAEA